jgi:drug/metabolite transporter (DMT)-like permease
MILFVVCVCVCTDTILKGTAPLFVLLCGLMLRVEKPSRRTSLAILLVVIGLSFVAGDRFTLPDRTLGFALGLTSVFFTGVRWAITQLLMRGQYDQAAQPAQGGSGVEAAADAADAADAAEAGTEHGAVSVQQGGREEQRTHALHGSHGGSHDGDEHRQCGNGALRIAVAPPPQQQQTIEVTNAAPTEQQPTHDEQRSGTAAAASTPSENGRTHPLGTMLHTMPVIALLGSLLVLALERDVLDALCGFNERGALGTLVYYLSVLSLLVFCLVLAEFHLVLLTSSLTVAVFGVLKELITVAAAAATGDRLSNLNIVGLVLCLLGNLLYFQRRGPPPADAAPSARPPSPRRLSPGGRALAAADGAEQPDFRPIIELQGPNDGAPLPGAPSRSEAVA